MAQKKVNYMIIPQNPSSEPYQVLAEAMVFHDDLDGARIGMAWRVRTKEDVDGRIVLGRCFKFSDLNKEFANFDFIIVLNHEYWEVFNEKQRLALVDHELCHAAPSLSDEGMQRRDERGRRVWRIRKHDIEEFTGIVERHGLYKRDLERFVEAISKNRQPSLLETVISEQTKEVPHV